METGKLKEAGKSGRLLIPHGLESPEKKEDAGNNMKIVKESKGGFAQSLKIPETLGDKKSPDRNTEEDKGMPMETQSANSSFYAPKPIEKEQKEVIREVPKPLNPAAPEEKKARPSTPVKIPLPKENTEIPKEIKKKEANQAPSPNTEKNTETKQETKKIATEYMQKFETAPSAPTQNHDTSPLLPDKPKVFP